MLLIFLYLNKILVYHSFYFQIFQYLTRYLLDIEQIYNLKNKKSINEIGIASKHLIIFRTAEIDNSPDCYTYNSDLNPVLKISLIL